MPWRRPGTKKSGSTAPRTIIGQWLRAMIFGETEERRQLTARLNGGRRGWNNDEAGVVQAACELAVRRYFGPGHEVRRVSDFVSFIREADSASGKTPRGQLEMEAVIRSALGEADVDVSGIIPPVVFEIQIAVTGSITYALAMPGPEIIQLINEAERIAFDRGWNPPLAT